MVWVFNRLTDRYQKVLHTNTHTNSNICINGWCRVYRFLFLSAFRFVLFVLWVSTSRVCNVWPFYTNIRGIIFIINIISPLSIWKWCECEHKVSTLWLQIDCLWLSVCVYARHHCLRSLVCLTVEQPVRRNGRKVNNFPKRNYAVGKMFLVRINSGQKLF